MRLRIYALILGLALGLALGVASTASAQDACFRYASAKAVLKGRVFPYTDYGPPGYGETPDKDARRTYLGLTPELVICVKAGAGASTRDEYHVGVVKIARPEAFPKDLLGKVVSVTGTFRHLADEDPPFVAIAVRRVQLLPQPADPYAAPPPSPGPAPASPLANAVK